MTQPNHSHWATGDFLALINLSSPYITMRASPQRPQLAWLAWLIEAHPWTVNSWCIQGIRCPWSYTHTIYSNVLSIHLHNLSTHYHFTIPRGPSSKMFKVLVPELLGCFHTCEPSGSMPAFPRNPQLCHAAVSFHDANTDSKRPIWTPNFWFRTLHKRGKFEYVWICLNMFES